MSQFFVGQRVKKVRGNPANNGVTGQVVAVGQPHLFNPECTLRVRVDHRTRGSMGDYNPGDVAATNPQQWEPILPEGMKPAKWEDCLWQPQTELEAA